MDSTNIISLRKLAEEKGIPDLDTARKAVKKVAALIIVAGLEFVDRSRFEEGLEAELESKVLQAARRTNPESTGGSRLGLVRARLAQVDRRLEAKDGKIAIAQKALAEAKHAYDRAKATTSLAKLRKERENIIAGKARDEELLNELLNGPEPESDSQ